MVKSAVGLEENINNMRKLMQEHRHAVRLRRLWVSKSQIRLIGPEEGSGRLLQGNIKKKPYHL